MIVFTNLDQVSPWCGRLNSKDLCAGNLCQTGRGQFVPRPVRNSDYDFKALIPPNLTAGTGVANEAPLDSHYF
jgi:hypothetical protein